MRTSYPKLSNALRLLPPLPSLAASPPTPSLVQTPMIITKEQGSWSDFCSFSTQTLRLTTWFGYLFFLQVSVSAAGPKGYGSGGEQLTGAVAHRKREPTLAFWMVGRYRPERRSEPTPTGSSKGNREATGTTSLHLLFTGLPVTTYTTNARCWLQTVCTFA